MRKKPKYILRAEGICHFVNVSKHFKMTASYLRLLSNEYIFTVNKSKHKTSIDLYEKSASQNYLTVLVFSELLKHIIECQTFYTSKIFWIVRYRILFINYFSKYALKWLLLNYMFMLLNRQLFEKIFIDILENTYTEYIKIAFWTV